VTLFGESAGAQDTCLQVVSPGSAGLFHRAVSESGGCTTFRKLQSNAEQQMQAFAEAVGCASASDQLACLRDKPVGDLLIEAPVDGAASDAPGGSQFSGGVPRWDFNPVVDGEVIPDQPRALVEAGAFAKVPYLLGSNFEEGKLFLLSATAITSEAEYLAALERLFKEAGPSVAAQYPIADFAAPQDALVRVWGDYRLVCPTYDTARRVAAQGAATYLYDFARPIPALSALLATHGVELPYVFGTLASPGPEDAALSDTIQGYWTRFAETGDPNGQSALEWPAYDETTDPRLNFDVEPSVITGFRNTECVFWNTNYDAAFP
jgi:para-nitrobenzyl esterase